MMNLQTSWHVSLRPVVVVVMLIFCMGFVFADDTWDIKVYPGAHAWEGVKIDGKLTEPVWQRAPLVSGFMAYNSNELLTPQTAFRLAYDKNNLYLAVECEEPLANKLAPVRQSRDALAVFSGECLEIFIDPKHNNSYYQFGIDTAGSVYDSKLQDASWNDKVETVVKLLADRWIAEISIDWQGLGVKPEPGMFFGLNICRDRYIGPVKQWTCWSQVAANFHDPVHFGHVVLSPTARQIADVVSHLREGGRNGAVLVYGRNGLWGGTYRKMAVDALERIDAILAEMNKTAETEADNETRIELQNRIAGYRTRVVKIQTPVKTASKLDAVQWTQLDLQISQLTQELGRAVWDARLSALLGQL